jgi:hypothetical protein
MDRRSETMLGRKHLKPVEFVDVLEGGMLPPRRRSHLDHCEQCQAGIESIRPLYEDLGVTASIPDGGDSVDFEAIRRGIRQALLARAVKRSRRLGPLGLGYGPLNVRGLTLALFVLALGLGGMWHYRTAHTVRDAGTGSDTAYVDDTLFLIDAAEALEVEATAWSGTDIFAELAELDTGEQETLRELIAMAIAEGGDPSGAAPLPDPGALQSP